jgi:hypothetical protein
MTFASLAMTFASFAMMIASFAMMIANFATMILGQATASITNLHRGFNSHFVCTFFSGFYRLKNLALKEFTCGTVAEES